MTGRSRARGNGTGPIGWLRRASRWLWRGLLLFLEVIGLRRARSQADREAELLRLRLIHSEFRKLLSANDRFLEAMAELEQKLHQAGAVDRPYLQRRLVRASVDIYRMIGALNQIAENRYAALVPVFERLAARIENLFQPEAAASPQPVVLDLDQLGEDRAVEAGNKLARLAELRNLLQLPTPDGFVVTAAAYRAWLGEAGAARVRAQLMTVFGSEDIPRVSQAIREQLASTELPPALAQEILGACDRLGRRLGQPALLAVRSSALEEDGERSFAGQFLTRLGVDRAGLLAAYREVVASLFAEEPMHYRRLAGSSGEAAAMPVGVLAMVDAWASGVVYSREPGSTGDGRVLIQAVYGLGVPLLEGRTSPESIRIDRDQAGLVEGSLRRTPGRQQSVTRLRPAGLEELPLSGTELERPCLTDRDACQLARWALLLEEKHGALQDIEWALDQQGRLLILQARPLGLSTASPAEPGPVPGARILLAGGETAAPGLGTGLAVHVDEDSDLQLVPAGAVLIAPRSSPKFVRIMDRVAGIITDAGSTTGHMASIARELQVPALLGTGSASREIPAGALVTLDAGARLVYEGAVAPLARRPGGPSVENRQSRPGLASRADRLLLQRASDLVIPLRLTDPRSSDFAPAQCATLHDLARFVHEKSYEEMFGLGRRLGDARPFSYLLDLFLPLDLYLIDLGGGVQAPAGSRKVKPQQITSLPLAALLRGMTHEKLPRFGPRPLDARGLLSVMMRHAVTNPEAEPTFRDPSYAMISDSYLNYTSRVGYHFGVVDTFCSPSRNRNYINLHFRGGAADLLRRSRRARVVAEILEAGGLHAEVDRDAVHARLGRTTQEETMRLLEMIGRLLQFVRQMDVAMTTEESVALLRDAFLRGDYALSGEARPEDTEH